MFGRTFFFFFQAEDGIRDLVRSRGLGDVYKRQPSQFESLSMVALEAWALGKPVLVNGACDVLRGQLSLIHI